MSEFKEVMRFHDEISARIKTAMHQLFSPATKSDVKAPQKSEADFSVEEIKEKIEEVPYNTLIDNVRCPHCDSLIDIGEALGNADKAPEEGDLTVCDNCGELAVFNNELVLRKPTPNEILKLCTDVERSKAIANVQKAIKERNAKK